MSWSFSRATPTDTRPIGHHYSEHTAIKLYGSVRYPETFKYPTLECYLHVDPLLLNDKSAPRCIGSMQATRKRLIAYVAVNNDRFNSLIIAASRLVALEINAEPLRYRKAKVMGTDMTEILIGVPVNHELHALVNDHLKVKTSGFTHLSFVFRGTDRFQQLFLSATPALG